MYDNIGINKEKRIKFMNKRIRIPKTSDRHYYLYSCDYDDGECCNEKYEKIYKNYYEDEYDYDNDEYRDDYHNGEFADDYDQEYPCDAFCEDLEDTYEDTIESIKKIALISAGVIAGISLVAVLLGRRR